MSYIPTRIEVEISSYCNAKCLACNRIHFNDDGSLETGYDLTVWKNPNTVYNLNLSTSFLEDKIFSTTWFKEAKAFITIGNNGDPMANPEIADIFEKARYYNPTVGFAVHTNGSIGAKETFKHLAKLFNSRKNTFWFAIDGLEDTNHYYRVGVDWDKAMENSQAFINAGGYAGWKFVPFKHNIHQIAKAKKLSKQLGFNEFELRNNILGDLDYADEALASFHAKGTQVLDSYDNIPSSITKNESPWVTRNCNIKPQCSDNNMIYISSTKKLYPCCWFEAEWNQSVKNWWEDTNWNDLSIYDVESIMQNNKLKELINSFNKEKVIKTCQKLCGLDKK
jgi:MoaA/NifB/PqqE/SkfB family radical SAM enzyme